MPVLEHQMCLVSFVFDPDFITNIQCSARGCHVDNLASSYHTLNVPVSIVCVKDTDAIVRYVTQQVANVLFQLAKFQTRFALFVFIIWTIIVHLILLLEYTQIISNKRINLEQEVAALLQTFPKHPLPVPRQIVFKSCSVFCCLSFCFVYDPNNENDQERIPPTDISDQ